MNAELLVSHLNRIAEGPEAVPRVRQFILDLAVRGKLVEQASDEESAFELLRQLETAKAQLISQGRIRNQRTDHAREIDDWPFSIPASWRWCRLSQVGAIVGGGTPPSGDPDNFARGGSSIAWLTPYDLGRHSDLYISHGSRDLTPQGFSSSSATMIPKGSILFTSRAPIGYTAIAANDLSTNQGFKSVVPYIPTCNTYIAVYFQAFGKWIDGKASGTTFREVSGRIVASLPFPLPPLAEQQRIVAKVGELMALCDRLEEAQRNREKRRDRLTTASHYYLNNSDDSDKVRGHGDFFTNNLAQLAARPEQVKPLRDTILDLAVRGKLVRQESRDEPAAVLLKRVKEQKERLIRDRAIPRQKAEAINGEIDFAFPRLQNWEAVNLGSLCNFVTSGSRGWGEFYSKTGPKFIRAQNIRFGKLHLNDLACVSLPQRTEGARTLVAKGDLLIVITGAGVTNPALLEEDLGEAYVSQHVALVRPTDSVLSHWFLLCLMARSGGRADLLERAYGAGKPGLNLDNIRSLVVPIPPLAEQRRIVAKVYDLMTLCDRLEAQLTSRQDVRRRLLDAILGAALNNHGDTGST